MTFILASASSRRKELMEQAGFDFEVVISDVEEILEDGLSPKEQAKNLAEQKALAVASLHSDQVVIGADTIVVLNGDILGKPVDAQDALKTLKRLNGNVHEVITGVAIVVNGRCFSFANITKVTFYEMKESWIEDYVKSGEPMDKAGSYGIQGLGFELVEKIEGDFYSVMGLPIAQLKRELALFGINTVRKKE